MIGIPQKWHPSKRIILLCKPEQKFFSTFSFVPSPKTQTVVFEKSCILPRNIWISWDIHLTLSWVHISRNHTFTAILPQPLDLRNPGISWWLKVPWHREDQRALLFLWIHPGAPRGWVGGFFCRGQKTGWTQFQYVCLFIEFVFETVDWVFFVWNLRLGLRI